MDKEVDDGIAAVMAAFPDAKLVEVRDIEPIPWCKAFDNELALVREEGRRAVFYQELLWAAYGMERKLGWAAVFYKDTFGSWPPWDWKDKLVPVQTTEATWKLIRRRDNKARREWKAEKERERAERLADQEGREENLGLEGGAAVTGEGTGEDGGVEGKSGDQTGSLEQAA